MIQDRNTNRNGKRSKKGRINPTKPKYTTKETLHHNLKQKSPWFGSIMNPLEGADVKIPDETGVPTGTLQIVQRVQLTVHPSGMCGIRVVSPYINSSTSSAGNSGYNYQIISAAATIANVAWDDSATAVPPSQTPGYGSAFAGAAEFKDIAETHRVVSAEVSLVPETAGLTNKGQMMGFYSPFDRFANSGVTPGFYMNHYGSTTLPVSSGRAIYARWVPFVREEQTYRAFYALDHSTAGQADGQAPYWSFGCIATGAETLNTFIATIVVNYEYVPKFNTLNIIDAAPSPSDTEEESLVKNWVLEEPASGSVSIADVSKSPAAAKPNQEEDDDTGLGMIFDVMQEALPIIGGVLSIL